MNAVFCWYCKMNPGEVCKLECGHLLCKPCITEKIYQEGHTEECKQPCPACLRLCVPKAEKLGTLPLATKIVEMMPVVAAGPDDTSILPCFIRFRRSPMKDDIRRQKALLTAAQAIRGFTFNSEKANYLRNVFNADTDFHWQCVWREADCDKCTVSHTFSRDNCIVFRMGKYLITLWAQK